MNLFIAGWDLPLAARSRAAAAVRSMTEAFPLLDTATVGSLEAGRAFAAWMHWPVAVLGPRRYVHRTANGVTLFDGVAVDASERIAGHDARSLADHWTELDERLEGHFLAVKIVRDPLSLEVINDPFGLHPAFVHRGAGGWWLSNSVSLLARAAGLGKLDLEGVANLLERHHPGGDHTLVEGVAAMPPGQRWRWRGDGEPERTSYAPLTELARTPRRSFGVAEARALADAMGGSLRALSKPFAPLMCPITSGRDTRMITGLMLAQGLAGDYFTAGDPDGVDARHGAAIARRFGLPHRLTGDDHDGLMQCWDEVSRRSVLQTDGFVTLAHARNASSAPQRLDAAVGVQLFGAGGEIARAFRQREAFLLGRPTVADAIAEVLRVIDRGGLLVRAAVRHEVRRSVDEGLRRLHDLGIPVVDLPDALSVTESNRRWSGAQARQIAGHKGVHMPLYCRAYVRAAFTTPPAERLMERVPYALLGHLSPELRAMPTQVPWSPQSVGGMLAQRAFMRQRTRVQRALRRLRPRARMPAGRKRERHALLHALLPRWRERFLDTPNLDVWGLLEREVFEALTGTSAPPRQVSAQGPALFQVGTVLTYEEALRSWVDWRPPVATSAVKEDPVEAVTPA